MAKTIRELEQEIGAKRDALRLRFEKATVNGEIKMTRDEVDECRQANAELKDLGEELDSLRDAEAMRRALPTDPDDGRKSGTGDRKGGGPERKETVRPFGQILDESKAFQALRAAKGVGTAVLELSEAEWKTLVTLSDMSPQNDRQPMVPSAVQYQPVSDLFIQGTTDGPTLEYYEETTFTNSAAARAEGDAFAESALSWTLRTDPTRSVGTWIPITEEALSDNAGMENNIRDRLGYMVMIERDRQLMLGDGNAPNIMGLLSRSSIQTQARGTDPGFDTVFRAMTKVRTTGQAEPTAAVFHPNNWATLVLTRTLEGVYILGNPGDPEAGKRLWGLAVRTVPGMTENTGVVGAFRPYGRFVRRKGLTITISSEHSDFFIKNKLAIKADERIGLEIFRQVAFCKMTGLETLS